ncbi:glucokinase [Candidatus Venteria ishoeyi]|uniref:Glucokinase n=1 Tax=Candidatus Venteria ishoeyi TaxID=1899563 RepID=A0A1H6F9E9_9GAMM|nr:glucokinase [Candidatus Venteria ishoeyi]SEH05929.1 Glucokinase [Candidatus Venteria ishoeyi]
MKKVLRIFVADIGGTSSRLALYNASPNQEFTLLSQITITTTDYTSIEHLLQSVIKIDDTIDYKQADISVLAVPGPVIHGTPVGLVNLPWDIHLSQDLLNNNIHLINDFEAQAYGCMAEQNTNFLAIRHPEKQVKHGFVVIGAGTGLGHCATIMDEKKPITCPSEAGQISFPFQNSSELQYLEFLRNKFSGKYPNGDRVVSGQGLALLHEYLTGEILAPDQVVQKIDQNSLTTEWFAKFLARDCRNYALTFLEACDMLYLSGGVLIKNPFLVDNQYFIQEFIDCDTKHSDLERIGVRLVKDELIALLGAAKYGFDKLI